MRDGQKRELARQGPTVRRPARKGCGRSPKTKPEQGAGLDGQAVGKGRGSLKLPTLRPRPCLGPKEEHKKRPLIYHRREAMSPRTLANGSDNHIGVGSLGIFRSNPCVPCRTSEEEVGASLKLPVSSSPSIPEQSPRHHGIALTPPT